ncbi:MAG: imidazole glycerol phosphate synthase subunit HisH [Lentisphaeria bacterium]|nr:imidazole glycerol phosphate synthase subunit HisH [Lentisphaeria bacterium]
MSFIALIDYGMGNLRSVCNALEFVGADVRIVTTPAELKNAAGVILPGVGAFGEGMEHLNASGFSPVLRQIAAENKTPLLGICLGMQMMLDSSEESPGVQGLGIFPGKVLRFPEAGEKIPQIGWNSVVLQGNNPFVRDIAQNSFFYFVHSFYALPEDPSVVAARCHYMIDFAAALGRGSVFAAQFHPEKSQDCGLALIRNFVNICNEKVCSIC